MNTCTRCKWYEPGDTSYGEQINVSYPARCLKRPHISNLKQFPFERELECFKSIVPTESAQSGRGGDNA